VFPIEGDDYGSLSYETNVGEPNKVKLKKNIAFIYGSSPCVSTAPSTGIVGYFILLLCSK
jgi:hypothetical protein